jgi:calcitonin receptor-like
MSLTHTQKTSLKKNRHSFFLFYSSTQAGCVFLHIILHYFLLTNYAWMLCEGFYLHTVLVAAFVSEQKLVRWLITIGWGAPAIFIVFYSCFRGYSDDLEAHQQ